VLPPAAEKLERLDRLLERLTAADALVAKTLKVTEVAQMSKLEARLRQYLLAKWQALAKVAAEEAGKVIARGGTSAQSGAAVRRVMGRWADEVKPRTLDDLKTIYRLARQAMWTKLVERSRQSLTFDLPVKKGGKGSGHFGHAGILHIDDDFNVDWLHQEGVQKAKGNWLRVASAPDFDLLDERAMAALERQNTFWIGEHYKKISDTINDLIRSLMVEEGEDRRAAGKRVREEVADGLDWFKTPDGYSGTAEKYFEGVAANAATTARAQGQVRTLDDLNVKRYTISNPEDSKTCPVCEYMAGKVFTVQDGMKQLEDEVAAEDPEDVQDAHPWLPFEDLKEMSIKELVREGQALPPYHFNCRCTCDIALDTDEDFDALFEDL
jgi:predicted RNA-binding protein YlqC (UPF0109 family)